MYPDTLLMATKIGIVLLDHAFVTNLSRLIRYDVWHLILHNNELFLFTLVVGSLLKARSTIRTLITSVPESSNLLLKIMTKWLRFSLRVRRRGLSFQGITQRSDFYAKE